MTYPIWLKLIAALAVLAPGLAILNALGVIAWPWWAVLLPALPMAALLLVVGLILFGQGGWR